MVDGGAQVAVGGIFVFDDGDQVFDGVGVVGFGEDGVPGVEGGRREVDARERETGLVGDAAGGWFVGIEGGQDVAQGEQVVEGGRVRCGPAIQVGLGGDEVVGGEGGEGGIGCVGDGGQAEVGALGVEQVFEEQAHGGQPGAGLVDVHLVEVGGQQDVEDRAQEPVNHGEAVFACVEAAVLVDGAQPLAFVCVPGVGAWLPVVGFGGRVPGLAGSGAGEVFQLGDEAVGGFDGSGGTEQAVDVEAGIPAGGFVGLAGPGVLAALAERRSNGGMRGGGRAGGHGAVQGRACMLWCDRSRALDIG